MKMGIFHGTPAPGKVGGFPRPTPGKVGGFPQHRRPANWADFHTAPAPGKVGGFPTAAAPGKVGWIPHSTGWQRWADSPTGARQGPAPGKKRRIPQHRRPADNTKARFLRPEGPTPGKENWRIPNTGPEGGRISKLLHFFGFPPAPAPGKVGGFPHSTGNRRGKPDYTRHRRPAR